ncbi:putative lipase ROG1 [Populus nigra]|uniref:putative lipase ROG1 n=1 Tax=Populus nigra TaxID=3691 RepID=UPI002B264DB1|nr:putative lipase ROG1 [Populus nigra]XP_061967619.1 putative lipase ROG1 [Populus nigra]XP_061967621.1 putative lipase ROG1 [Populus nigra]
MNLTHYYKTENPSSHCIFLVSLIMGSVELQGTSGRRSSLEIVNKSGGELKEMNSEKKSNKKSSYFRKFGCLKIEENNEKGSVVETTGEPVNPTHLIIMVNGIVGSAQDWKFAAKQFLKKYPRDVVVHRSKVNSSMLTFDGVDVMGDRLAEEVISVKKRHPSVQKISFVGHSLGGLIARYAIARLYERDITKEISHETGNCKSDESEDKDNCVQEKSRGTIAGLEPMNFITSATPHLGSRFHKQVPMFCGFYTLEKAAARIAGFLGRTGKHLFLTDVDGGKPPLLFQMTSDSENLNFISALESFKRRVAYANASFDHIVGWCTSSLRRRDELPKRHHLSRHEKYPHIVNVKTTENAGPQHEISEVKAYDCKTIDMEEEMIRGLTKLSWERVDVNLSGSMQRFLAHSTIQVKISCINSDGADVVQHMVDNFLL